MGLSIKPGTLVRVLYPNYAMGLKGIVQAKEKNQRWIVKLEKKGASYFCTLAILKGTETLGLLLLWVVILQLGDAPERNYLEKTRGVLLLSLYESDFKVLD